MDDNNKIMEETQGQQPEVSTANDSGLQEDIFSEIFGTPATEQFVATTSPEQQPDNEVQPSDTVPVNESPKDDNAQFQYWQSQADKKQVEVDLLKEQLAGYTANTSNSEAPVEKETDKLTRPVKPRRPADYSHSEALDNPESESAKYLTQKDVYVDDLADYMEKAENQREQVAISQEQQRQVSIRNQQVMTDLQSKYSYNAAEAADFIDVMNDPSSMSLDNLVELHKIKRGQRTNVNAVNEMNQRQMRQSQQKVQLMENRQKNLSVPQPLGVQSGASVQSSNKVEDQMMDAMIKTHGKRNPFG